MGYLIQYREWEQPKTTGTHYHIESEGKCLAGVDTIREGWIMACRVYPTMGEVTGVWYINHDTPDDHDTCICPSGKAFTFDPWGTDFGKRVMKNALCGWATGYQNTIRTPVLQIEIG